jgi:hypothetical protein
MFLYLVLYLQDILGYSALGTGVRLLIVSGTIFLASAVSGRLSERVPVRWLIGPGLALVGIGLFLMAGLSGASAWTHLIPGFVVAGLGSGLVNPPLAATAIGVVAPQRAGMASGVNSTFRQVGIATSVAALGTIFTSAMERNLAATLARVPVLAGTAPRIAASVSQGGVGRLLASLPPAVRGQAATAIRSGFAAGMNDILIVTGAVGLAGGVAAVLLIRGKDFVHADQGTGRSEQQVAPALAAEPGTVPQSR